MKVWLALWLGLVPAFAAETNRNDAGVGRKVYVIPIREDIGPPLTYLVRRGVKKALQDGAELLVLDMKTNGGRVSTTEDIIEILGEFRGNTVTFVNDRAFSAGAFISVATKQIYMVPNGVIGAAAPILMNPLSGAPQEVPASVRIKMTTAVRALVRRVAQRNGYDVDVVEAMIDENRELIRDGQILNPKGDLLTLTATEATQEYGTPPKPLLAKGIVADLDELLTRLGYAGAQIIRIVPTGAETLGFWLNAIGPLLLIIGGLALYLEFKTPGFGLPGIVGIVAFALYFLGGYVAGFSGWEWGLVFVIGLALLALEWFVFPGTLALGITGAVLMLFAIVMALVDVYPAPPVAPGLPAPSNWQFSRLTVADFNRSLMTLVMAFLGLAAGGWALSRWLPGTGLYATLVSQSASGATSDIALAANRSTLLGQEGVAISPLRPGGKAQFGDRVVDVISQGDLVARGARLRIIGFSGAEAVIEVVG